MSPLGAGPAQVIPSENEQKAQILLNACAMSHPDEYLVFPEDGYRLPRSELCLAAIRLDPRSDGAWYLLGKVLECTDRASWPILSDERLTPDSCFANAIHLNPKNAGALDELGWFLFLNPTASIRIIDPKQLTLINRIEPMHIHLLAKAHGLDSENFQSIYRLGVCLLGRPDVVIGRKRISAQACFVRSILHDSSSAMAFFNLGRTIPKGTRIPVTFEDGSTQEFDSQSCYLKSIELNPSLAEAFYNLALTLLPGTTVTLNTGEVYTKQMCYLKAIELNPSFAEAFYNLGTTLAPEDSVIVKYPDASSKELNNQDCYIRAIELNPNDAEAFCNLGFYFSPDQISVKLEGKEFSREDCYRRALSINPNLAEAWTNFGFTFRSFLPESTKPSPVDGSPVTQRMCHLKAIELGPITDDMFLGLGSTLGDTDLVAVKFPNGKEVRFDNAMCYVKAIALNPRYADAFLRLSRILRKSGGEVQLADGQIVTADKCFSIACEIEPRLATDPFSMRPSKRPKTTGAL